jgi:hypothetical protein
MTTSIQKMVLFFYIFVENRSAQEYLKNDFGSLFLHKNYKDLS